MSLLFLVTQEMSHWNSDALVSSDGTTVSLNSMSWRQQANLHLQHTSSCMRASDPVLSLLFMWPYTLARTYPASPIQQFLFLVFCAGFWDSGQSWHLFTWFGFSHPSLNRPNGIASTLRCLAPPPWRYQFHPNKWPTRVLPLLGLFLGPTFAASSELRERRAVRGVCVTDWLNSLHGSAGPGRVTP